MENKMVKFEKRANLLSIRYITAKGEKRRFYTSESEMEHQLAADCGNFLQIYNCPDRVVFSFCWLNTIYHADGSETLTGTKDSFSISKEVYDRVLNLEEDENLVILSHEQSSRPHLDFSNAQKAIQDIAKDKAKRRCLSKAVRDNFRWQNSTEVRFYPDFHKGDFYFVEETPLGRGISGGLIFEDGKRPRYSVHT